MAWSLRTRIAWANILIAAAASAGAFWAVFEVVAFSSFRHLDEDLRAERLEVMQSLSTVGDSIVVRKMPEWQEAEHQKMEANPTFIQIVDAAGRALFKSENLQAEHFLFKKGLSAETYYFNEMVGGQRLRFGQFPICNAMGRTVGHLTVAVSQAESHVVLRNLRWTLVGSYFFLLLALFASLWTAASRAIWPINDLIGAAESLDELDLAARLPEAVPITEMKRLARAMNGLLERIERSANQQRQFTADVAHELRTPLAAIKGTLEVLLRKPRAPEHYAAKLAETLAQTDRLARLYDDMLALARIESGSVEVRKKPVFLKEAVEKSAQAFTEQIAERGLFFEAAIDPAAVVDADPALLGLALNNLFSNAIKYNRPRGRIRAAWDAARGALALSNDGEGIEAAHLPFIFDRFWRADSSRSSQAQGHGIGLSVVKKVCDLQGFAIWAESAPGKGATFWLRF